MSSSVSENSGTNGTSQHSVFTSQICELPDVLASFFGGELDDDALRSFMFVCSGALEAWRRPRGKRDMQGIKKGMTLPTTDQHWELISKQVRAACFSDATPVFPGCMHRVALLPFPRYKLRARPKPDSSQREAQSDDSDASSSGHCTPAGDSNRARESQGARGTHHASQMQHSRTPVPQLRLDAINYAATNANNEDDGAVWESTRRSEPADEQCSSNGTRRSFVQSMRSQVSESGSAGPVSSEGVSTQRSNVPSEIATQRSDIASEIVSTQRSSSEVASTQRSDIPSEVASTQRSDIPSEVASTEMPMQSPARSVSQQSETYSQSFLESDDSSRQCTQDLQPSIGEQLLDSGLRSGNASRMELGDQYRQSIHSGHSANSSENFDRSDAKPGTPPKIGLDQEDEALCELMQDISASAPLPSYNGPKGLWGKPGAHSDGAWMSMICTQDNVNRCFDGDWLSALVDLERTVLSQPARLYGRSLGIAWCVFLGLASLHELMVTGNNLDSYSLLTSCVQTCRTVQDADGDGWRASLLCASLTCLAHQYRWNGKQRAALDTIKRAVSSSQTPGEPALDILRPSILCSAATLRMHAGDWPGAVKWLKAAAADLPSPTPRYFNWIQQQLQGLSGEGWNAGKSEEWYSLLLEAHFMDEACVQFNLALCYAKMVQPSLCMQCIKNAVNSSSKLPLDHPLKSHIERPVWSALTRASDSMVQAYIHVTNPSVRKQKKKKKKRDSVLSKSNKMSQSPLSLSGFGFAPQLPVDAVIMRGSPSKVLTEELNMRSMIASSQSSRGTASPRAPKSPANRKSLAPQSPVARSRISSNSSRSHFQPNTVTPRSRIEYDLAAELDVLEGGAHSQFEALLRPVAPRRPLVKARKVAGITLRASVPSETQHLAELTHQEKYFARPKSKKSVKGKGKESSSRDAETGNFMGEIDGALFDVQQAELEHLARKSLSRPSSSGSVIRSKQ